MTGFELPRNLADSGRADWLAALPDQVSAAVARWQLTVGPPFQPGGVSAWVAPARTAAGDDCVVKIGWPHPESRDEAAGLRAWDGRGSIRLLDTAVLAGAEVLLLERCRPGIPLTGSRPEAAQDEVVAGLLRRLWIEPPAGSGFRPLTELCDYWADGVEFADTPVADPGVLRAGLALWRELPRTATEQRLLCTDLHPDNVLQAERENWLMIDPKPYVGDPCFEPLQHLLNFPDRLAADPAGLARRMARLLELDADRVTSWLFARCVLHSIDHPWAYPIAAALAS